MACSTCKTKKNINLKQSLGSDGANSLTELIDDSQENQFVFTGRLGKFLFFTILVICAITPIINIAAIYVFYIAVYGKNKKKQKDVTEHTNKNEPE